MCGIVGMSFRQNVPAREEHINKLRSTFTGMLVEAQARGCAATGVVMVTHNGGDAVPVINLFKAPLSASEFTKTEEYQEFISQLDVNTLSIIGHTRAVTTGSAHNNENNHPHIAGSIIGVHNGGISNDRHLWEKYKKCMTPRGSCDSEVFFALVNREKKKEKSTDEAMEIALNIINGWWAFALIDITDPGKVFLIRDIGTPLEIGWWGVGETAMFASNYSHITRSFNISKLPDSLRQHDIKPNTIITLDSTIISSLANFLVHARKIKSLSFKEQSKLIKDNKEVYAITQGDFN